MTIVVPLPPPLPAHIEFAIDVHSSMPTRIAVLFLAVAALTIAGIVVSETGLWFGVGHRRKHTPFN
jgi:hypothetical protein